MDRDGAAALTSRAVTAEADCGKGVLHTHFARLDEFVAELVLDRFASSARRAEALDAKVGQATVAANLQDIVLALLEALPPAVVGLPAKSRVLPARGAASRPRCVLLLLRLPGAEQVEQPCVSVNVQGVGLDPVVQVEDQLTGRAVDGGAGRVRVFAGRGGGRGDAGDACAVAVDGEAPGAALGSVEVEGRGLCAARHSALRRR